MFIKYIIFKIEKKERRENGEKGKFNRSEFLDNWNYILSEGWYHIIVGFCLPCVWGVSVTTQNQKKWKFSRFVSEQGLSLCCYWFHFSLQCLLGWREKVVAKGCETRKFETFVCSTNISHKMSTDFLVCRKSGVRQSFFVSFLRWFGILKYCWSVFLMVLSKYYG